MPKFKIVCFILAAVLAAVGTVLVVHNMTATNIGTFEKPTDDPNVYLDKRADLDITDPTADVREFLFVAHKVLLSGNGFKGVSRGTSTAVGIAQNVLNTRYVVGDFDNKRVHKEMVTKGIVSNAYQLYLVDKNYIFREPVHVRELEDVEWKDEAQPLSEEAYYNRFGHRSDKLCGYILNWDTVLSGEFVGVEDGLYTFHYILDTETATPYLRREMITNGGLQSEPTFNKCEIYVTMDAEFNVKFLRTDCSYKAQTMGINAGCTEDITETFEPYEGDLPDTDFFTPYLGQVGDDITKETTSLDALMDMFAPYLNGEDLQVEFDADVNGSPITARAALSGLDISDLTKLRVNLNLGELDVAYVHDGGKLYLTYQDFCGSTTIDGVTELAGVFSALLGQNEPAPAALSDDFDISQFDPATLLDNLTHEYSEDKSVCTVSLPVELGDISVTAKLVGVAKGETYAFSYADIDINGTNIHIEPHAWAPAEIPQHAPEILGLADLLKNGKLSLHADVELPVGEQNYDVTADLAADLASRSALAQVALGGDNIDVCFADNVLYVTFGNVKFKLDVTQTDRLVEIVKKFVNTDETAPAFNVEQVLGLFGAFTAKRTAADKVALTLNVGEAEITLTLAELDDRWQVEGFAMHGYGVEAEVVPSEEGDEIAAPADGESYADVTELADTFDDPIADLLHASEFGANFQADVTIKDKTYNVGGKFVMDDGAIKVLATVYDGAVGIVDAEVIYADNTVYLTLNGIKVAFAVGSDSASEMDFASAMDELLQNEEIKELLDSHEDIKQFVTDLGGIIKAVQEFDPSTLLDVNFEEVVSAFEFRDGTLSLAVDGTALGFDGIEIAADVFVTNGNLSVRIKNLRLAGVELNCTATVFENTEQVTVPQGDDYILKLHGEALGAELDVALDLVHMNIWADVQYGNEKLMLRFAENNLYVVYGGARICLDASDLTALTEKLQTLAGEQDSQEFKLADIVGLLSALNADLTGETPNLSLDATDFDIRVNFRNVDNKLVFDGVEVGFTLNNEQQKVTLAETSKDIACLEISGNFVDGNMLVEQALDTVAAFKQNNFALNAEMSVTVGETPYFAQVKLNLNGGVYADVILRDGDKQAKVLVSAEIYLVDGTLFMDVNGIRQSLTLPTGDKEQTADVKQIFGVLEEFKGTNDVLDSLIDALKQIPDDLNDVVFSEFISDLYYDDNALVAELNLAQLNLQNVTLAVKFGSEPSLNVTGLTLGQVAIGSLTANVTSSQVAVTAPTGEYTTELTVDIGSDITAKVFLDLYNQIVRGEMNVAKNKLLFEYADGKVLAQLGDLGASVATDDFTTLIGAIGKLVNLPELPQTDDVIPAVKEILGKLLYERADAPDGYNINLTLDDVEVSAHFVCDERAKLDSLTISQGTSVVTAKLAEKLTIASVDKTLEFVDITEVVDVFAQPIADLLAAKSFGAVIENVAVKVGEKQYEIKGRVDIDESHNIKVDVTVYEGETGILSAEVIVTENGVYLTLNGIKAAVKLEKSADGDKENVDIKATIEKLKENEQIAAFLAEHEDLSALIDQLTAVVGAATGLDIAKLDVAELLTSLTFDGDTNTLKLAVNGSNFELGSFNVTLGEADGNLNVQLDDFALSDITLQSVRVTVLTGVTAIAAPNADDYILNLHVDGSGLGVTADITADLYNMDIWADVTYENTSVDGLPIHETAQIRFVENKLYLHVNNINLVFDIGGASELVKKLMGLFAGEGEGNAVDVNEILGNLVFDLAATPHCVKYEGENFGVAVNFNETEEKKLTFADITVTMGSDALKVTRIEEKAEQLRTSDYTFYNGNLFVDDVVNVVSEFKGAEGISAELNATVNINGKAYNAYVAFVYHNGIYVTLKLTDPNTETLLLNAQITLKKDADGNDVLYLIANGIEQKVALPKDSKSDSEGFDLKTVIGALKEFEGVNDTLDEIIKVIENLPKNIANLTTVSDLVKAFSYEAGTLNITLSEELGLGAVTLKVNLGEKSVDLDGLKVGNISAKLNGTVAKSEQEVEKPSGTFVTELDVTLGELGNAKLKLDLFNKTVKGVANIYKNTINIFYDGSAVYLECGEVGLYADATSEGIDRLMQALAPLFTMPESGETKDIVTKIFGLFAEVTRTAENGGYKLSYENDDMNLAITFDKEAKFNGLTVTLGEMEISAKLAKVAGSYADVNTNKKELVDVAALLEKFAQPIADLLAAKSFGAVIENVAVKVGEKQYEIKGRVDIDENHNIKVDVTVYEGETGILSAEVIVTENGVYLTLNGIKAAVKLEKGTDSDKENVDIKATIEKLKENEQIAAFLAEHKDISDLIDQLTAVVGAFTQLDIAKLDVAELLTSLTFDGDTKTLKLAVNGSNFELGSFNVTLGEADGNLNVQLDGFTLSNITLQSVRVTVLTGVTAIATPNADDYILNLHVEGLGVTANITADLYNMDIWADVTYTNNDVEGLPIHETAQILFTEGNLYLHVNNINLVFDSDGASELITKLMGLFAGEGDGETVDVNKILADIVFDLAATPHCVKYEGENFGVAVNFNETEEKKLTFADITVTMGSDALKVTRIEEKAEQLRTSDYTFYNGNLFVDDVVNVVSEFKGAAGISATVNATVNINDKAYNADVTFVYHNGIYVNLKLTDPTTETLLLDAQITLKKDADGNDVLYLIANGIEQKVALPKDSKGDSEGFDLKTVIGALKEFEGVNDTLDEIIKVIENLPKNIANLTTVSDLVTAFSYENGSLGITLSETLGLGAVTLKVNLGEKSVGIDGLKVGNVTAKLNGTVAKSEQEVATPVGEFVTELDVTLGEMGNAKLKLDLFNKTVKGVVNIYKNTINIFYDGSAVYLECGEVGLYADATSEGIDRLMQALAPLFTMPETGETKDIVTKVFGLLAEVERTAENGGYKLSYATDKMSLAIAFDKEAKFNGLKVTLGDMEISAKLAKVAGSYADVNTNKEELVDVAALLEKFAQPIADLLAAKSFGAVIENVAVKVGEKQYEIKGRVDIDESHNIKVDVTVYEGETGILSAEVIVTDNGVYLTLNGIKAAVKLEKGGDGDKENVDIKATIEKLKENEQIAAFLAEHEDLSALIDQLTAVVGAFTQLDIAKLDVANILTSLTFDSDAQALKLAVNGSNFELGSFNVTLGEADGNLNVQLDDFALSDITLQSVKVTVLTGVTAIAEPKADDYILNLHVDGSGLGVTADITADLYNMNIWASVTYENTSANGLPIHETAQIRFVENKLYLHVNNINLVFDSEGASELITKLMGLFAGEGNAVDVNEILGNIVFDLATTHSVKYEGEGFGVAVNFTEVENKKLSFADITVTVGSDALKVTLDEKKAEQLDPSDYTFYNGNLFVDDVVNVVSEFKGAAGISATVNATVNINDKAYSACVTFVYHNGICVTLKLTDPTTKTLLLNAQITLKKDAEGNDMLYLIANGIEQKVALPKSSNDSEGFDLKTIVGALKEFEGVNETLDEIIKVIEALPDKVANLTIISDLVTAFSYEEGTLNITLSETLGLGAVTLKVNLGEKSVDLDGLKVGNISANINGTVAKSGQEVATPVGEFVTELDVTLGEMGSAKLKLDLFNKTVKGVVNIYKNTINIFYDGSAVYLECGEVGLYADATSEGIDRLMQALAPLFTMPESGETKDIVTKVLGILAEVERTATDGGYKLTYATDELSLSIAFDGEAKFNGLTVTLGDMKISVAFAKVAGSYSDVSTNKKELIDVAALLEKFAQPIADLLAAKSFGAVIENVAVKVGEKQYEIKGRVDIDESHNIKVDVTVYEGETGILSAEVIVTENGVYLTLNGIKAAVKLEKSDKGESEKVDIKATIEKLKENEQIAAFLAEHEDLSALIDQLTAVVGAFTQLDIAKLDVANILTALTFDGDTKALKLAVNGSNFELGSFNVTLGEADGNLNVQLDGFTLSNITLQSVKVKVLTDVGKIDEPKAENYILNLHLSGSGLGVTADVTADLYNMDIWADVTYTNTSVEGLPIHETAQIRFVENKLYLHVNNINLVFDIGGASELITKLMGLFAGDGEGNAVDVNEILGNLVFDLAATTHCVKYESEGFGVAVNFNETEEKKLTFADITVTVGGDALKVTLGKDKAEELRTSDYTFYNGNLFVDDVVSVVSEFKGAEGISAELNATVNINGKQYSADVAFVYHNGIYVNLKLTDPTTETLLLNAQITLKKDAEGNDVLYLIANGIEQKVALPKDTKSDSEGFDLKTIVGALKEFEGVNETLDEIIKVIEALPDKVANLTTVSDLVTSFSYEAGTLNITLSEELGLGAVTLKVNLGEKSVGIDGLKVGNVTANINGTVAKSGQEVATPVGEFVTELDVTLGELGNAKLKLDLFNKTVKGTANIYKNTINIFYDGSAVYLECGEVGLYADATSEGIDRLMQALAPLFTMPESGETKDIVTKVFGLLAEVERTATDGGYKLTYENDDMQLAIAFDGEAKFNGLTVTLGEMEISVAFAKVAGSYVDVNTNKKELIDVAALLEKFAQPIADLLAAKSFGAVIENVAVKVGEKQYEIKGRVDIDENHNIKVDVTVYEGETGILSAEVIVTENGVYLTLNGIKAAVKLEKSADGDKENVDIKATIEKLKENEQIAAFLAEHKDISDLIDQLTAVVGAATGLDIKTLNFANVITALKLSDVLTLNLNAEVVKLGNVTVTLGVSNNKLKAQVSYDGSANIRLIGASVTVLTKANAITPPSAEDYILNLHLSGSGVDGYIVADIYNMDVKAQITYTHDDVEGIAISEKLLARLAKDEKGGYVLYVQLNNVKLSFAVDGIGEAIEKLMSLFADESDGGASGSDINEIFSKLSFNLADNKHNIVYESEGLNVSVNFDLAGDKLSFSGVEAKFGEQTFTLKLQSEVKVDELDTEGDFTDGVAFMNKLYDVLNAANIKSILDNTSGVETSFSLKLVHNKNDYNADVTLVYKDGLKVSFVLKDGVEKTVANGEITIVDDEVNGKVIYIDVNGIKQAIKPKTDETGEKSEFHLDDLTTALEDYRGIHEVLDAVIDFVQGLPIKLRDRNNVKTVSDLIGGVTLDSDIVVTLATSKLGLGGDITLRIGESEGVASFSVGEIVLQGKESVALTANISGGTLVAHSDAVTAPDDPSTYVTELSLTLKLKQSAAEAVAPEASPDSDMQVKVGVRLDLYNNRIFGWATLLDNNKVTFELDVETGDVYAVLGDVNDGSKMRFNVYNDIDEVKEALKDMGVTMPETQVGEGTNAIKKIIDSLSYKHFGANYVLSLELDDMGVSVGFNVAEDVVTLGTVSLNGGEFGVTANQTAVDANNVGLPNAKQNASSYMNVTSVLGEFAPALGALKNAENGYQADFEANITLDSNEYTLKVKLALDGKFDNTDGKVSYDGNIKLVVDLTYNEHRLIQSGTFMYIKGSGLYVEIDSLRLYIPIDSGKAKSGDVAEGDSGASEEFNLDSLRGYNEYLNKLLDLVETLAETDFAKLNYTELLGIAECENGLALTLDGGIWNIGTLNATVKAVEDGGKGVALTVSGFDYRYGGNGSIAMEVTKLQVIALDEKPNISVGEGDDWSTNVDIKVHDNSGITNTIHVNVNLVTQSIYVKIESVDEREDSADHDTYYLFAKYSMELNKLWLSNRGGANASINIGSIQQLVDDVQEIVNKVAKENNNVELPNLFGGGLDLNEVLRSLKFVHDDSQDGIGINLEAMGFGVKARFKENKLTATIDISNIFADTTLEVLPATTDSAAAGVNPHADFVKEIDDRINGTNGVDKADYVELDRVLGYWFYGANGEISEDAEKNGVIYSLVNTNAWMFRFDGTGSEINISRDDGQGGKITDSYRINGDVTKNANGKAVDGSFISFYFNKTDTDFGINDLMQKFGTDEGYVKLFELLNSLQLRAHLCLEKKANGESNYSEMLYLDIALLRYEAPVITPTEEDGSIINKLTTKPKARLYISYDSAATTQDGARTGVFNATVSLDSLDDVIGLKDALDSVLNGAVSSLIESISDMISEMKNNMPTLQLGRLARLFDAISYGTGADGNNLKMSLRGAALSDNIGNISLDVQPLAEDKQGDDHSKHIGAGLFINELKFSYNDISISLAKVEVTASPFYGENTDASTADTRTYDYVDHRINSYLNDNATGGATSGALSTAQTFNKNNVGALGADNGYNMSNYMEFDSIRELLIGLIITASDRTFALDGTIVMDIKIGDLKLADYKINLKLRVDIEGTDSYWALLIDRPSNMGLAFLAFKDLGGKSYLLFDSRNGGTFSVVRDSNGSEWLYPDYSKENMTTETFMDGIVDYIMELFNFSNLVRDQIKKPRENKPFGIEDLLDAGDSYQYAKSEKRFYVRAELGAINDMLGTLNLNIYHEGNMDEVKYVNDESGGHLDTAGVRLSNLKINITLVNGLVVADLDLNLLQEKATGLAKSYVTEHNYSWT